MNCMHPNFVTKADVHPIVTDELTAYVAEFTVHCASCGMPMEFIGAPEADRSFESISTDEAHLELRVPIKPFGALGVNAQSQRAPARMN